MTTRSAARGPLPGLLLPFPRCPVLGAPRGPLLGLGPARGHPSTDSDGPSVSDPALQRSPGRKDTSSLNTHGLPCAPSPLPGAGTPGWGAQRKHARPAGLLGAPDRLDQQSLGTLRQRPPARPRGASRHPHHTGRGGGAGVCTPALPCRGWSRPAVPWLGWVANLDRLKTSAQVTADDGPGGMKDGEPATAGGGPELAV